MTLQQSLKKDLLRLFRILASLRKGLFWVTFLGTERLEYDRIYWRNVKLFQEIQNEGNKCLQVFVLLTTIFVTILGFRDSLPGFLNMQIVTACYLGLIALAGALSRIRATALTKKLHVGEDTYRTQFEQDVADLSLSDRKDEFLTTLTELKMVEELADEVAHGGPPDTADTDYLEELHAYAEQLEKKANLLRKELGETQATFGAA